MRPYNPSRSWFGLLQFRSPLLSESLHLPMLLFSLPKVLRWFTPLSFASAAYRFSSRMLVSLQAGYPIRLPGDLRMCAPPPGFSQLTTAFFA